jgi:hypothetical protein
MLVSQSISRAATETSVLHSEVDPLISRKTGTLKGGSGGVRKIVVGMILASITVGSATVATATASADNVGGGTLTLDNPAFTQSVLEGNYIIRCVTAGGAGVAEFSVEKPDGKELKKAKEGEAYNTHLKFTIAAAAADFAVGDTFTVEVTTTDGKATSQIVEYDPNADDGSQRFWGFSLVNAEASDGVDNVDGVTGLRRLGVVKTSGIVWPQGMSDQDKHEFLGAIEEKYSIVAI